MLVLQVAVGHLVMHWDSGLEDAITTQFSGAVEDFKLSQPDSPALEPKT